MASPTSITTPPLDRLVRKVCNKHPDQVELYHGGKGCIGFLVGQVIKLAKGAFTDIGVIHRAVVQELEGRTEKIQ